MKKLSILILSLLILPAFLSAQSSRQFDERDNKGIVYDREFTMDARLHTYGFAIAANWAKINTYYKTTYFQVEIGELKHQKDYRQNSDNQILTQGSLQSFILGKQNNLFVIRAGYGKKKYLSEKAKRKGVAIGLNYEAGVTLGLLKPYYLDIKQSDQPDFPTRSERYDSQNPCDFLNSTGGVYGSSGFFKGMGELRPLPGVHFKAGVHFDWGAFDEFVKAIEVGVAADVFYKRAPILIHIDEETANIMNVICPHQSGPYEEQANPNRPFFINLYVTLHLGRRW